MSRRARHVMTPARRAALKKAQAASARARRRAKNTSRRKKVAAGTGVALVAGGIAVRKSNVSTIPKAVGYTKHYAKNAKLAVPGPGTRVSVRVTSGRSAITGRRLAGGSKGSIQSGPARDVHKKRYQKVSIVSPSGSKRGVSLAGYAAGRRKPSLGKRLIVEYKHYALLGNKTPSKVPNISDSPTILGPNQRFSINQQIAESLKKGQNSSIKSAAVNKKAITTYSVTTRSSYGRVKNIINELVGTPVYGTGGKKKYKKK